MARTSHVVLKGSRRVKDRHAIRIGNVDPTQKIDLTIVLTGPKLPEADEFVGQTLTRAKLTEKFGADQADVDKVAKSLKKFGLTVTDVALETRSMRVSGTARQIEAAFRPKMAMMHSARDGDYRGRRGTIQIPAEIKDIITGVFGLDQRRVAHHKSLAAVSANQVAKQLPLGPAALERLYNFPPGDGAGQSIAIAAIARGYFADDVEVHCHKFKRPMPKVNTVTVGKAQFHSLEAALDRLQAMERGQVLGSCYEVMMDVEIIAGLCPKANLSVYFFHNDQRGWIDFLNEVLRAKPVPVALSISLAGAEEHLGWSKQAIIAIDERLNMARLLGITTCVASGDDGSGAEMDDDKVHVEYPSSSVNVLSVGGTMLEKVGSGVEEVVWWESPGCRTGSQGGATGGGVSTLFQRPAWQNVKVKSLNPRSIEGRVLPDVAALAGNPRYHLTYLGSDSPNGGTSAATPLWAALIARINAKLPKAKRQRFLTPLLYQKTRGGKPVGKVAMRSISRGHNISKPHPGKGYKAGPGFDAVTGWGVPDGKKLLKTLEEI